MRGASRVIQKIQDRAPRPELSPLTWREKIVTGVCLSAVLAFGGVKAATMPQVTPQRESQPDGDLPALSINPVTAEDCQYKDPNGITIRQAGNTALVCAEIAQPQTDQ